MQTQLASLARMSTGFDGNVPLAENTSADVHQHITTVTTGRGLGYANVSQKFLGLVLSDPVKVQELYSFAKKRELHSRSRRRRERKHPSLSRKDSSRHISNSHTDAGTVTSLRTEPRPRPGRKSRSRSTCPRQQRLSSEILPTLQSESGSDNTVHAAGMYSWQPLEHEVRAGAMADEPPAAAAIVQTTTSSLAELLEVSQGRLGVSPADAAYCGPTLGPPVFADHMPAYTAMTSNSTSRSSSSSSSSSMAANAASSNTIGDQQGLTSVTVPMSSSRTSDFRLGHDVPRHEGDVSGRIPSFWESGGNPGIPLSATSWPSDAITAEYIADSPMSLNGIDMLSHNKEAHNGVSIIPMSSTNALGGGNPDNGSYGDMSLFACDFMRTPSQALPGLAWAPPTPPEPIYTPSSGSGADWDLESIISAGPNVQGAIDPGVPAPIEDCSLPSSCRLRLARKICQNASMVSSSLDTTQGQ